MDVAERARDLVERYWDQLLELDPILGTFCGDERFDDRLPDPGPRGRAAAEAVHRAALTDVAAIDGAEMGVVERTSLDVMEAIAQRHLSGLEHRTDRLAAASHLWGPGQLVGEIASLQQVDTPERLDRYEARLRAIPAYLMATAEIADEGVRSGVTSPQLVAERSIAQVERLLATPAEDSPALMRLGEDLAAKERIAGVVRDVVGPAYERYLGRPA